MASLGPKSYSKPDGQAVHISHLDCYKALLSGVLASHTVAMVIFITFNCVDSLLKILELLL